MRASLAISPGSSNQPASASPTRKSKNGSRANLASCPRALGFCIARSYSVSPLPTPHPKRIRARQKRSRRSSKPSVGSGCSKLIRSTDYERRLGRIHFTGPIPQWTAHRPKFPRTYRARTGAKGISPAIGSGSACLILMVSIHDGIRRCCSKRIRVCLRRSSLRAYRSPRSDVAQ